MDQLGLVQAIDRLGQGIVIAVPLAAYRRFYPRCGQPLGVADGNVLRTSVTVMDQGLALQGLAGLQRLLQGIEHKVRAHRTADPPAHDTPGEDISDESDIDEALRRRHVGKINGLITNDKFCVSRVARLQLTWSRYEVWRQRTAALKTSPSVEIHFCGGCHETTMADSSADDGVNGRPAAMGSSLPMAAGVGPTRGGPDRFTPEGDP